MAQELESSNQGKAGAQPTIEDVIRTTIPALAQLAFGAMAAVVNEIPRDVLEKAVAQARQSREAFLVNFEGLLIKHGVSFEKLRGYLAEETGDLSLLKAEPRVVAELLAGIADHKKKTPHQFTVESILQSWGQEIDIWIGKEKPSLAEQIGFSEILAEHKIDFKKLATWIADNSLYDAEDLTMDAVAGLIIQEAAKANLSEKEMFAEQVNQVRESKGDVFLV